MWTELPLTVVAARDEAMAKVQANAGPNFMSSALVFVKRYLETHSEASGEEITDAAKKAGIVPKNTDRAFGPVYSALLRDKIIERAGYCLRRKGHGTGGGSIYRLKK